MIRRPPRSTRVRSSAASDVYKRQEGQRASPRRRRRSPPRWRPSVFPCWESWCSRWPDILWRGVSAAWVRCPCGALEWSLSSSPWWEQALGRGSLPRPNACSHQGDDDKDHSNAPHGHRTQAADTPLHKISGQREHQDSQHGKTDGLQRGGERLRLRGDALCPSYHFPETGNLRPGQHQSRHHQTQVKDRPETMAAEDDEEGQNQKETPQGSARLRQEGHPCQEHRQGGQDRGYPPQARNPARIPSSPLHPSSTPGAR